MVLLATLRRSGGIEAIARHLAIPTATARPAIAAAIAPVVESFRRYYAAGGAGSAGISHLLAMLGVFGGGQMAIRVLSPDPIDPAKGEALLTELFGPAGQRSRLVMAAPLPPGISDDVLGRLVPLLAMLVGGYLAARAEGWENANLSPAEIDTNITEFESLLSPETDPDPSPRAADDPDE